MKKILVPCDFSKPAIDAYRFALDFAERSKGTILLVHAIELPVMHDTILMPVLDFEEQLLKDLREKASDQFTKINERYNKEGIDVSWEVKFGPLSASIIEAIRKHAIDLVVMGSHGASGMREYFIGSNAEKIIRHADAPVLITKDYTKKTITNIVFPNTLDTEDQDELVTKVKALQKFLQAHLHLVWINTPLNFTSDIITQKKLQDFARHFGLKDFSVHIFNHSNEEDGIIEFTKFVKGDLIAMGTHGRKGISRLLNGSLAEDVANHTDSLIWTYALKNEFAEAHA